MCGIVGRFSYNNSPVIYSDLKKMSDSIAYRGPDGEGFWINESQQLGFGHRRLSILDLSDSGEQPMHFENLTITYNGEIYNYLEVKKILISKGYSFKTDTDTEVILIAFKEYGEECLQHFDGMFSFVIWDDRKKELFAARDRFGEKPFYYFKDNSHFVFGSEMKAIFASGIPKVVSNEMTFLYLAYDVVENSEDKKKTFYKDIFQLEPAHFIRINAKGEFKTKRYWDINTNKISEGLSLDDSKDKFKQLFDDSVKRRMRSDVPVGSSLSGGIDSSVVVGSIMSQFPGITLNTFTARFKDKNYDEGEYIQYMLDKYPFNPNFCWPQKNVLIDELDQIFHHQEEPFGSTSILAQWEVMKLAKSKNVTVLLDGQGADETIAGYFKYFAPYLAELNKRNRGLFKQELSAIETNLEMTNVLPKMFQLHNNHPRTIKMIGDLVRPYRMSSIAGDLNRDFTSNYKKMPSQFNRANSLNESLYFDSFKYGLGKLLRFSDRNSMAFSREVRLPYLSHELVEYVFSLPAEMKINKGWTKYILRESMSQVVPKEISWRKDKKGYKAPDSWMSDKHVQELVNNSVNKLKKEGLVEKPAQGKSWQYLMTAKLLG